MTDHLLPRYRPTPPHRIQLEHHDDTPTPTHPTQAGGDKKRLRGIPVVGSTTGTSPGTDPLQALLATEHAIRRHRRPNGAL